MRHLTRLRRSSERSWQMIQGKSFGCLRQCSGTFGIQAFGGMVLNYSAGGGFASKVFAEAANN
jgi:hypothetical protein